MDAILHSLQGIGCLFLVKLAKQNLQWKKLSSFIYNKTQA